MPSLDVVIVTWKHRETLDACLAALARASPDGYTLNRVVLVDNALDDPTLPARRCALPLTRIGNLDNQGFAPACNQGAAGSTADYLLFLNPDACVGRASLAHVIAWCERPSSYDVAIVGLPLADDRGVAQATCGRFPTARMFWLQTIGLGRLGTRWLRGFRMTEWSHSATRQVDYVSGACLLVRRTAFEALGGFDPRFTVYLEDADLCLRAARRGWRTVFLATDAVTHVSGWDRGRDRAWRLAHSWRSLLRYVWTHLPAWHAVHVSSCVLTLAVPARIGAALVTGSVRDLRAALSAGWWLAVLLSRDLAGLGGFTRQRWKRTSPQLPRG